MDPEANMREQVELANSIITAFDNSPDDLSDMEHTVMCDIIQDAARLSELVLAMRDWNAKR